jgi:hypothetical protein
MLRRAQTSTSLATDQADRRTGSGSNVRAVVTIQIPHVEIGLRAQRFGTRPISAPHVGTADPGHRTMSSTRRSATARVKVHEVALSSAATLILMRDPDPLCRKRPKANAPVAVGPVATRPPASMGATRRVVQARRATRHRHRWAHRARCPRRVMLHRPWQSVRVRERPRRDGSRVLRRTLPGGARSRTRNAVLGPSSYAGSESGQARARRRSRSRRKTRE